MAYFGSQLLKNVFNVSEFFTDMMHGQLRILRINLVGLFPVGKEGLTRLWELYRDSLHTLRFQRSVTSLFESI